MQTKTNNDNSDDFIGTSGSRSDLKKKLRDKKIPYISMLKGNSYMKEPTFEVNNDEMAKAIQAIRVFENLRKTRSDLTGSPEIEGKFGSAPEPSQFIYSGSIMGNITMIGNFVFDPFSLIWIDFGVNAWSGLFNIMDKEDTIERGEFITRIRVMSESNDPFGTRGMKKKGFRKESQGSR